LYPSINAIALLNVCILATFAHLMAVPKTMGGEVDAGRKVRGDDYSNFKWRLTFFEPPVTAAQR
jgi:hypothetical protein